MPTTKTIACTALLVGCISAQVMQEDFNGTTLGPVWQPFPYAGTISVSGGRAHLALVPNGNAQIFPYLRIIPDIGVVPSPRWSFEFRVAWLPQSTSLSLAHFAATPSPVHPGTCPFQELAYPGPNGPVHVRYNGSNGIITVKAGATLMDLGPIDSALHTYRWVSDGTTVTFYLDYALMFTGLYDGYQPNNVWIGNACGSAAQHWTNIDVDKIRLEWGQILDGPATASIGTTINYHLAMAPLTSFLLDVSVTGTEPGIMLTPGGPQIPLNPPFLNTEFGSLVPGVFVNFSGSSDSLGLAAASVNLPAVPSLIGLPLSALFVTTDPLLPGQVTAFAQPMTTSIVGP